MNELPVTTIENLAEGELLKLYGTIESEYSQVVYREWVDGDWEYSLKEFYLNDGTGKIRIS